MDALNFFEPNNSSSEQRSETGHVAVDRELIVGSISHLSMLDEHTPPDVITGTTAAEDEEAVDNRLTLAYERLFEIPKTIVDQFSEHIQYLDISHNKITNLDALVYFKNLTSLIADDNPINEQCFLPPLPNLQLLWLNRCRIRSLFPWVQRLQQACPGLQYLSLMGNPAAPSYLNGGTFYEYLQYRLFVISQLPSLQHLDDRAVSAEQRAEARRLYRRPLLERLLRPAGGGEPAGGWLFWLRGGGPAAGAATNLVI